MRQALAVGPTRIRWRRKAGQHVIVEEMGERSMPDVVQESGHPERLDDEPFGRDSLPLARRHELPTQARIERAPPQSSLVHDPEAVREA